MNRVLNLGEYAKKGVIPWNKGLTIDDPRVKKYVDKNKEWTLKHPSKYWLGKKRPEITGENHWSYGKKRPEISGKNNNFWKGGISKFTRTVRRNAMQTFQYKKWRTAVFTRDDYTCQKCGQYSGFLYADHIKPWSLFSELRYLVSNGQTLCKECHKKKTSNDWKLFKLRNEVMIYA